MKRAAEGIHGWGASELGSMGRSGILSTLMGFAIEPGGESGMGELSEEDSLGITGSFKSSILGYDNSGDPVTADTAEK